MTQYDRVSIWGHARGCLKQYKSRAEPYHIISFILYSSRHSSTSLLRHSCITKMSINLLGFLSATTGRLVYVRGCKDRDKYTQTKILWETANAKRGHKILMWKTQNREKPRGSTNPQIGINTMRGSTIRDSEATTLSSSLSGDGHRVTHSSLPLSLSLSLTHYYRGHYHSCYLTKIYTTLHHYNLPKLHIYLYNFLAIYIYSPQGHIQAIYNYSLSNRSWNWFSILVSIFSSHP